MLVEHFGIYKALPNNEISTILSLWITQGKYHYLYSIDEKTEKTDSARLSGIA